MAEGTPQFGKYQLLEELGRGGFAVVYLTKDITLNRAVALKILDPQLLTDSLFYGASTRRRARWPPCAIPTSLPSTMLERAKTDCLLPWS